MEAGAEYPAALGAILEGVLNEPVFLTHPDYVYGGTALLRALHKGGDATQRERLERLILDLPKNVRLRNGEERNPIPARVEHAQDRLLGALEEPNIVLEPSGTCGTSGKAKATSSEPQAARAAGNLAHLL